MNREEAKEVLDNLMSSHEVREMLMVNRARVNILVQLGKLKSIKELNNESLFWKPEVEQLRNEMLKDTRTNLYKNQNRS